MKCPRCSAEMHPQLLWGETFTDAGQGYLVQGLVCPACDRALVGLRRTVTAERVGFPPPEPCPPVLWPRASLRQPVPADVPERYASLAAEAGLILQDSPRASAELSRRCLQQMLRDEAKAPPGTLYDEIEWVISHSDLPSHAKGSLHSLREIGNMAAHPNKGTASGDYLEVEPGEAEWTLDVLDALFDHFFVGPAKTAARKAALDAKLGRPPKP